MKYFLFLFVLLSGCFALEGKNIIFPKQTSTDYVILKPTVSNHLAQLTVCLRSYTDLSRDHVLFSIATAAEREDNTFLIFSYPPDIVQVSINQEEINFKVDDQVVEWRHTCVSWDSKTGLVHLWVNGKSYPQKGARNQTPIKPKMNVIIGQDQDHFGGGFDAKQSFVGEMRDVNMWDYVLSPYDMKTFFYLDLNGNIFNWTNGNKVIKGGPVILENEDTFK